MYWTERQMPERTGLEVQDNFEYRVTYQILSAIS